MTTMIQEENTKLKIDLGLPPKELILANFHDLMENVHLITDDVSRKILLTQTIPGHAHNADGKFRIYEDKSECIFYPNTGLEDVVSVLEKDASFGMSMDEVKQIRFDAIIDVKNLIKDILRGKKIRKLVNHKGNPIFGIKIFKEIEIGNPMNIVLGYYLGSIMDNYKGWRKNLEKPPYNIIMGGGEHIAVDISKLKGETLINILGSLDAISSDITDALYSGFHMGTLAEAEWEKYINLLYESGLIINKDEVKSDKNIRGGYVRYKKGKGISDNAAIIVGGKLFGNSNINNAMEIALGVFLADAVDTYDKFLPVVHKGGLDEKIGRYIEKTGVLNNMLTKKDKLNFIFLSAIKSRNNMPDCSQRYFLQIDPQTGDTAIENHLTYLRGDKPKKMILGHKAKGVGVECEKFYNEIEDRFEKYQHLL